MKLTVLGSSSSGNSYLLTASNGETLVIEAGVRFDKVKRALGFDLSKVVGCVVTHEHGDHARYAADFARAYIPVRMSRGTLMAKGLDSGKAVCAVEPFKAFRLGEFDIMPFPVEHDAAEPFGYLIRHQECGNVLFATDTYYLRYRFPRLSNILIECNYSQDILGDNYRDGRIDRQRYVRTVKSHMSYETCRETLLANDLSRVNNIVLIHLSRDNGDGRQFAQGIAIATGKLVTAARPGLTIPFDRTPY